MMVRSIFVYYDIYDGGESPKGWADSELHVAFSMILRVNGYHEDCSVPSIQL
jgi:ferredoxin-fold anticodon binding domain-containing protein